jgi:hypothetical protein
LEHEKPVPEAFWTWAEDQSSKCLPKSKLRDSFKYAKDFLPRDPDVQEFCKKAGN